MSPLPRLAQRVFNRPVAILPEKAEIIAMALADRLGIAQFTRRDAFVPGDVDEDALFGSASETPYDVYQGVAQIPVCGTLTHRLGAVRPYSGMTGYDGIRQAFCNAMDDPSVRAVMFDFNSPGGEVSGCFELAETIFAGRGVKPIWAICDDMAYSAAYALASACDRVVLPATGGVGSIGVVCMHVDYSAALQNSGIAVTLIQYGARKTDGAEVKPLSSAAAARLQADIDALGEMFVDAVAKYRGMGAAAVRATQAATYLGAAGITAGLADAVMAPHEAFQALLAQL